MRRHPNDSNRATPICSSTVGQSQSGILIVHVRESIPEDVLRADLVTLLDVRADDLVPLELIDSNALVPYQVFPRAAGFRTTLELYVGRAPASVPKTDLELARMLARHYGQDVLVSPVAETDPYHWELVTPAGDVKPVRERPTDGADGIVLDA
jgi:hypothetical protein